MKNIKTFISVVNSNCSVSEAADKLFVTQTAVTKRISALEQQINVKLFIRKNNKLFLSDAGKQFLNSAIRIQTTWDTTVNELSHFNSETIGSVRIATSMQAGRMMPPIINAFKTAYPKVKVELLFPGDSEPAKQLISKNEIDLAILHSAENTEAHCKNKILLAQHEVVIAAPQDINVNANSADTIVESLCSIPCLKLLKGSALDSITDHFLNSSKISNISPSQSIFFHRIGMLKLIVDLIELGLGWSIIPRAITTKKMKIIEFPDSKKFENTHILFQDKSKLNKPSLKFIELLTQYVNSNKAKIQKLTI